MTKSALYNTHHHIKRITQTGISEDSAEAIVSSVTELLDTNIATKTDLADLETRLVKWFFTALFLSAGLAVAGVGLVLQTFLP